MTSGMLPSPDQSWAHSTNSLEDVRIALRRGDITAIEADILMGRVVGNNTDADYRRPIMAHPPNRLSSLSTSTFIQLCLDRGERTTKHIKLDFKEIEAVQPTLEQIHRVLLSSQPKPVTVFLNADILPGPGCRSGESYVDSKGFLETCTSFLRKESVSNSILSFALSLGYKADYRAKDDHYTVQDAENMASLVRQCELPANVGLVLALNARCLACDPTAFDTFLHEFQDAQILAWTGTGEPAIPRAQIDSLQRHADEHYMGRIGFDCLESCEAER